MRTLAFAFLILVATAKLAAADITPDMRAASVGDCAANGLYRTKDRKVASSKALPIASMDLYSTDNSNDLYYLEITINGRFTAPDSSSVLLCIDGHAFASGSGSDNAKQSTTDFAGLDRATAEAIQRGFHTTRRDRKPLGTGLSWHFETTAKHPRVGDALPVSVRFDNQGPDTVKFSDSGGRRRRGRSYGFQIIRDGVAQPELRVEEPASLGGGGGGGGGAGFVVKQIVIPAKKSGAVTPVDLKQWATFDKPGVYEVRCSFSFTIEGASSQYWDMTATEVIHVEVFAS